MTATDGRRRLVFVLLLASVVIAACNRKSKEVVAYTSVDQVVAEPVLKGIEAGGPKVRAVFDTEETKSTGVLNRILAEAAHPQADVFWSGDPMRALVLVKKGLAQPYVSPNAAAIPAAFKAPDGSWTGFAARARVLLVNKNQVSAADMPKSIRDLASPKFARRAAIANPLFGTTTMHAAALFATWGDDEAKRFFQALRDNAVRVASSNGEVKRLVASGEVAIGVADTDDAHEALEDKAPVEVVWPDQDSAGTLVMPTVAVLIKNGPHPEAGRALVDFLLTADVERQLASSAAHLPLRPDVSVAGVRSVGSIRALPVDYDRLASVIERIQPWLRDWVGL